MQHERKTGAGSKKGLYGFVIDEKTARRIIKASTETQRKRMRRESTHQKTKVYFYEKGASPMKNEKITVIPRSEQPQILLQQHPEYFHHKKKQNCMQPEGFQEVSITVSSYLC